MNDCLRLQQYGKAQFFSPHNDAPVVLALREGGRDDEGSGEAHLASVYVYPNHKFKGGLTMFHGEDRHLDTKPHTGSVLVFEHSLLAEAKRVTLGRKYLARSEVVSSLTSEKDATSYLPKALRTVEI